MSQHNMTPQQVAEALGCEYKAKPVEQPRRRYAARPLLDALLHPDSDPRVQIPGPMRAVELGWRVIVGDGDVA